MSTPKVITLDFETLKIQRRPFYPPKPVSVAVQYPGSTRKPRFYAWGHPTENNTTLETARTVIHNVWNSGLPILFQNGKFDVDVAETHFRIPRLSWERFHDTLFLIFLNNPYQYELGLKYSAEELLNMPPEERDEVVAWLKKNCPTVRQLIPSAGKPKREKWEAYISEAPGKLVGEYAVGDVERTLKLFRYLYPIIEKKSMLKAYDRDRRLMPVLLDNERRGVKVDLPLLEEDTQIYSVALEKTDRWLRKRLQTPELNVDSNEELAEALSRAGIVADDQWVMTATGKRSVAKNNLTAEMMNDKKVAYAYNYRNRLNTCLGTFQRPWLHMAKATGGTIHTSWSQVRNNERGSSGAATGRMSSSPNFQNIPKAFNYVHPSWMRLPPLPLMRKYLIPDSADHVWIHRDYSQQELRILAHFEDGALLQSYLENPTLAVHNIVEQAFIEEGYNFGRGRVKAFDFQVIYGGGIPAIMVALGCTRQVADKVLGILKERLPGYDALNQSIKEAGKAGQHIRTWGDRMYYAEAPRFSKEQNRTRTFEYKMLNYLIQGSAADCTKEAIIRYADHPKRKARFLLSVHDEMNSSAHKSRVKEEMTILRDVMQSVEFDLPMLSDGKTGPRWGELTKYRIEEAAVAA